MSLSAAPPVSASPLSPVPWVTPALAPAIPCFICGLPGCLKHYSNPGGDGSHLKALTRLSRVQLLIIGDFLLTTLADWEQRDLLEVIEDRYQLGATIIASQCPIGDWHPDIGDSTLANAICDRLLHNAYRIELRGDSIRTRPDSTSENGRREAVANDSKLS